MQSLVSYTKNKNEYIRNVYESIDNNIRLVNESKYIIEHGKDIDNLLYKFKSYTFNSLYNQNKFNESDNSYKFTLDESNIARDMLIYICEDYRDKLLEELNIYESILENENLILNEGFLADKTKNIVQRVKQTWELGKDKVNQAIENIKTKIKEVNELIKDYASKAISTVKDMAIKLIKLLDKFNCTLKDLFAKMGFDVDKEEEGIENVGKELANNTNIIKKNNIYESYANDLQNIINEDDANNDENNKDNVENKDNQDKKGETVKQADKKSVKQMIWSGFKQLMVWAGVCVVIPGIVCGLFPGTLIALLVPVACKLLWNGYKIVKLYKQWKKVKQEWGTYTKTQKVITAIGMVASIIALAINFNSIAENAAPIWNALTKGGMNLFDKANLGIQPDVLTRGFAAAVKNVSEGKWPWEDFGKAFQGITDSFAEHTQVISEKIIKTTTKIGKSADKVFGEYTGSKFKSSTEAWTKFLKPNGIPIDKVPNGASVDVVLDGSSASKGAGKLIKFLSDNGYDVGAKDALNGSLNKICKNAGSIWSLKGVPIDLLKKAQDAGIELGHNGWFSILGGAVDSSSVVKTVTDIVKAASDMLVTIPIINVQPQNNGGFRVRLGEKGSKNYVYEVGKDAVKKESVKDYSEQYDKIKQIIYDDNIEYLKQLKEKAKESDDKNEINKKLEEFKELYNDSEKGINSLDCIIFYGHKVKEEKTEESYQSLRNYIIKEEKKEYTKDDVIKNLTELRDHLKKKCIENNATDKEGKNTYLGNTKMLLDSIFKAVDKGKTGLFKFDTEFKPQPYESVRKRVKDKNYRFGPDDIGVPAAFLKDFVYGKDTENSETYYEDIQKAFVDVILMKHELEKEGKVTDIVIGAYKDMLKYLKESSKFVKEIDNEEWVPLNFDENIDDKTKEKIEKTEDNNTSDNSSKETKSDLENADVTLTNNGDHPYNKDEDDGEDKPILILANGYAMDIANANEKGPRKDPYSIKGLFKSLEFIEIKKGTSKENLSIMLGEILHGQINNILSIIANKPIKDGKKYKLEEWQEDDSERKDFGMLKNKDIIDILNNPKNAKKYIGEKSSISIVQTEDDQKYLDKKKEEYKKKLENPDDKTKELVKKIDSDAIEDDKIKDDKIDEISDRLANYKLAQHKNENNKSGGKGFFAKLKNFVKGLFGGDKEKGKQNNELIKHFEEDEDVEENIYLNSYDNFINEMFKSVSLVDYIKQN